MIPDNYISNLSAYLKKKNILDNLQYFKKQISDTEYI